MLRAIKNSLTIDDDYELVKSIRSKFPDRVYLMPNYKCNLGVQDKNIYYISQKVSDLKEEDFEKAAEECQKNHQEIQQKAQIVQFDDK